MKLFCTIPATLIFWLGSAAAEIPDLGAVSKVGAGRVGDKVIRYVRTFNDSCLDVQILNPEKNWEVLSASSFCSYEAKRFDLDFADASFEDISVKDDGIHLTLSLTPLQPTGEQRLSCVIAIANASIQKLSCSENHQQP
jgi:hypothetical protein